MTIEELQQEILVKDAQIQTLNEQIITYQENEVTHLSTITEHENKIEDLRKFNNDLFQRVQQPDILQQKNEDTPKLPTINDIIYKLGGH